MADAAGLGKQVDRYKQGRGLNDPNKAWTPQEKADFTGVFNAPQVAPPATPQPLGEMRAIDDDVAAQQAANMADPSTQEKLNKMALLRAKYYGELK